MLESFRKHKKILLLLSGLILIVILTIMVMSQNKNSKFSDVNLTPDSITKIHIRMMAPTDKYSTDQFVIEERENIETVLDYVKKMSVVEVVKEEFGLKPGTYEFTYYMKDGKVKRYMHEFLAVTAEDGFENIFDLKEVIPQVNYVFTTKKEDVKEVALFGWKNENEREAERAIITNDELIDFVIKVGQENMLYDIEKAKTRQKCGVEFLAHNGKILYIVYISPDMLMYDELCEKIPEVKEFVEMGDTQK
ncbi:MAG TPA: hypothetical protein GXZ66_01545 [Clostridiaceae bacterium]|nr:hypothetical protein [Clostridiaceae bacterium]